MSSTRSSRNKTLPTLLSSTSSSSSYSSRYKSTKVETASRHSSSIVIEFGSASIKVGIAGESQPRCIIPSTTFISTCTSANTNHDPSRATTSFVSTSSSLSSFSSVVATPPLPTSSMQQSLINHIDESDKEIGSKQYYFHSLLSPFLHNLYTDNLYLKPKSRRAIILLPIHYSKEYRDVIENILLRELNVPSVKFISGSSLYTAIPFALGRNVGLVVDIGHMEGRIGAFFNRDVLGDTIQVVNVGKHFLINSICEEVSIQLPQDDIAGDIEYDIEMLKSMMDDILSSSNNHQSFSFSSLNVDHQKVQTIVDETIHDLYFNLDNPQSLIYAFLSCLIKCPIDIRSELVRNVCFIGGVVLCVPQFERRFLESVKNLFQKDIISKDYDENKIESVGFKVKNARHTKFQSLATLLMDKGPLTLIYPLPFSPSCINWVGGSVLGALSPSNDDGWINREV